MKILFAVYNNGQNSTVFTNFDQFISLMFTFDTQLMTRIDFTSHGFTILPALSSIVVVLAIGSKSYFIKIVQINRNCGTLLPRL